MKEFDIDHKVYTSILYKLKEYFGKMPHTLELDSDIFFAIDQITTRDVGIDLYNYKCAVWNRFDLWHWDLITEDL